MANMTGYTRILDPPTSQKAWKDIHGHAYYEKQTNVDKLVKKLKEATVEDFERKFDICLWYIYTTFDIISDLTFVSKQDLYSGAYVTGLLNTGSSALSWRVYDSGTETTATLLSGLTYYLLKNPDQMEKLVTEIWGSFQNHTLRNRLRLLSQREPELAGPEDIPGIEEGSISSAAST
ncbi:hypothetical protein F5882DRAFT_377646 [Hyaloscypha sp. PMI_1271]|nr:hypothetical protein F5882DRAFT_377646 [Hyaloscypha sp. PMI_1271]